MGSGLAGSSHDVPAGPALMSSSHLLSSRDLRGMAIERLTQGLCVFDKSGRLALCNRYFRVLYDLSSTAIWPTMPVADLMRACTDTGAQLDRWGLEILHGFGSTLPPKRKASYLDRSAYGRLIAVRCRVARSGWVVTFDDVTNQHRTEAHLRQLAYQDALTGLGNRVLFGRQLEAALADARKGRPFAVLCLDLDYFKQVNDNLGHHAGDGLLQQVAARLRASLHPTDLAARLGGDEFTVLTRHSADQDRAKLLGVRLVKALCQPYLIEGSPVTIGASLGIALAPTHNTTAEGLLQAADSALRSAKRGGRNTSRLFHPFPAISLG